MPGRVTLKGFDDFERDLDRCLSTKVINSHLRDRHEKEIVNAVIGSAKAGIGPGDRVYPGYSESYQKQIDRAGGAKLWLRGIGKGGRQEGMLDPEHFAIVVDAQGHAFLVWTAPDSRMGIYAEVHQEGLPIGRGGPRRERRWLHFENRANVNAVVKAYELTFNSLAAQFSAGRMPR